MQRDTQCGSTIFVWPYAIFAHLVRPCVQMVLMYEGCLKLTSIRQKHYIQGFAHTSQKTGARKALCYTSCRRDYPRHIAKTQPKFFYWMLWDIFWQVVSLRAWAFAVFVITSWCATIQERVPSEFYTSSALWDTIVNIFSSASAAKLRHKALRVLALATASFPGASNHVGYMLWYLLTLTP